jgi:hypothetical protein
MTKKLTRQSVRRQAKKLEILRDAAWLRAERRKWTMNGGLKYQWQVALIWMRDVNMAAKERTPRGLLDRLASREIAEHQLNTYFEMVDAQLTGS